MKRVFNFYSDPGHGWLKVPKSLLITLGISHKVSGYSYQRGEYAYLEEDGDVSCFFKAYEKHTGNKPILRENYSNKQSRIRRYWSYTP